MAKGTVKNLVTDRGFGFILRQREDNVTSISSYGTITLHNLSDSKLIGKHRAEDVRGRKVLDRVGKQFGTVDGLMIDDRELKVRLLRVATVGFVGLGETTFLIPVEAITSITDDVVRIDQSRDQVSGAPGFDPELVNNEAYLDSIYDHYGYLPSWSMNDAHSDYPMGEPRLS
jgi:sporulation protein YlmC with PRC-barrel domain